MIFLITIFLLSLFPQNFSSNVNLTMEKSSEQTRTFITYSLSFKNFEDIKNFYMIPFDFYEKTLSMDLRDSFKLRYYGYSTYPFRYLISEKKEKITFDNSQSNGIKEEKTVKKRFLKLNLNPFFEDFKENINWYIIDMAFSNIEGWSSIGKSSKKEFIKGLSLLGLPIFEDLIPQSSTSTQGNF